MLFWDSLAFSMIQRMLAIWSLVPLPFLNPDWTSGSSWFMYCWSLENFEHYFTSVWDECNCVVVWTLFGIVFLWDWNENWHFPVQSSGHCWVFQICWHIECITFIASSFRRGISNRRWSKWKHNNIMPFEQDNRRLVTQKVAIIKDASLVLSIFPR